MPAVLVFTHDGTQHRRELTGAVFTLGRAPDCEMRFADERVSSRHCRFEAMEGEWVLRDLRSTNRTFVNEEYVGEVPRRLRHGDYIQLGARDARIFEAMFEQYEQPGDRSSGQQLNVLAQLTAQVAQRDAELARVTEKLKAMQIELQQYESNAEVAARTRNALSSEIEGLREELTRAYAQASETKGRVENVDRVRESVSAEYEAKLRKLKRELEDVTREKKDSESREKFAASEVATLKVTLATAEANVKRLQESYDDVRKRLEAKSR